MGKFLIIDDDEKFCDVLADTIGRDVHEIRCAFTLASGIGAASEGAWDAVFLDVTLPDGDGLGRIREFSAAPGSPEVVIVTGRATSEGAEIAIRNGAWGYICKPPTVHSVRLTIQQVLKYRQGKKGSAPAVLNVKGIIGNSAVMKNCYALLADAAASDAAVLLTGETGVGKELFAHAIHVNSRYGKKDMVIVDCAALHDNLSEGTLFGHRKGAFTSADRDYTGLITEANESTLFLDEVGDLPQSIQRVFLRVLQEQRFRPLGAVKEVSSTFRLISATNKNLEQMVTNGQFRNDLYFRLQAIVISLPPLRDHKEDIEPIVQYHVKRICEKANLEIKTISADLIAALNVYDWPGNVRELIHAIEWAIASSPDSSRLYSKHLPHGIRVQQIQNKLPREARTATDSPRALSEAKPSDPTLPPMKAFRQSVLESAEKKYLEDLIRLTHGNMAQARTISGLSSRRLYELLNQYHISVKSILSSR